MIVACGKKTEGDAPASASSTASVATTATAKAEGGAPSEGAAHAAAGPTAYAGKYAVTPATMYVPSAKDWSMVKFKNDEQKMLGDGELTIRVDQDGRVAGGTEAGPLGASVLDGSLRDGMISATVRRKDPSDNGLTGTLVGKLAGNAITGTMKLAEANAAVVRQASFSASAK